MLFTVSILLAAAIPGVLSNQLEIHVTDHKTNVTNSQFCSAETASFGSVYLFWPMQAVLVNASPMNACDPVEPPPYQRNNSLSWIALVSRDTSLASGCPFDQKVLNAQLAGFNAVLVQNYEDVLLDMQPSELGSRVHIPAAMVTLACGTVLKDRFSYSAAKDRYSLSFEIPFPFDFHVYVISFAVIIGVCLLLSLIVWGIKFYRDWRRSRRNRLPRSSLKKLTVKKFEKGKDLYDCCAICLEDFVPGEKLRILPCNHAYHTKCVDQWLLKSRSTCPVCKRRVFPRSADSEDEDDGQTSGGAAAGGAAGPSSAGGAAGVAVDLDAESQQPQSEPEPSQSLSNSLLLAMQDERTPLLDERESSAGDAGAAVTSSSSNVNAAAAGTFDNAALETDNQEADDDAEKLDTTAAPASAVSVRVFVHSSCPQSEPSKQEEAVHQQPDA